VKARVGRNSPCICGSGKKFKKCCLTEDTLPEVVVTEDGGLVAVPAWLKSIEDTGRGPLNSRPFKTDTGILTAYTDESGNTGIEIFDRDQPSFFTGTLITASDLESESDALSALLARHELVEMHAAEIKEQGLELLADTVREMIVRHDCRFIFTEAEKRHFGVLKVADTILDSGNNKALMPHQYYYRALKAVLTGCLDEVLEAEPSILEEFWRGYTGNREPVFKASLEKLRRAVDARPDYPRNRQLLLDALDWGIAHPRALMDSVNKAFNSPNVIAMTQIVYSLHMLMDGQDGLRVGRFVHDRQSQFAPAIRQIYESASRYKAVESAALTVPDDFLETQALAERIEMPDEPMVGLQIADAALWLFKRASDGKFPRTAGCRGLFEEVASRGLFRTMNRRQFYRDANADIVRLMSLPMTDELEKAARAKMAEFEALRQARMREPE
jgi:hypothetical protein